MRHVSIMLIGILATALCLCGQIPAPSHEGIPPRESPSDYQYQAKAGTVTVGAEFTGHSVGLPEGPLTTEDFIVIETGVYGPAGARTKLAATDFSLRINGKKPVAGQPYGLVVNSLRNRELEPTTAEQKSKTSVGSGGQGQGDTSSTPAPYRVPDALKHEWGQRLQRATLPEGDRALPQGGLLYFPYRGKTEKITSLELIYAGPAGQFTIAMQP